MRDLRGVPTKLGIYVQRPQHIDCTHPITITACLTRIKYVDLQKCYPVKLGEALPWCCVPLLRRIAVRAGCRAWRSFAGRRLDKVPASLTQEVWAFAHPSDYHQISA
jgi:hypothetical protein